VLRTATFVVAACLLTACSSGDDTAAGAPASTPPASAPVVASSAPPAAASPAPSAGSSAPAPGPAAPSLSPANQVKALEELYARLDPQAQKQFCQQSDSVGPAALAAQVAQRAGGDAKVLEEFLVETCGRS